MADIEHRLSRFSVSYTLETGGTKPFRPPGTLGTGEIQSFWLFLGTVGIGGSRSFQPSGTLRTGSSKMTGVGE